MSTVMIIGDQHMPVMRRGYIQFLQRIADKHQPDRIVNIGDAVDWNSISYHEKSPSASSAAREYRKALKQFKQLHTAFPKADMLIGNHDCLTERKAITAGLPTSLLRSYNDMWEIDWKVHPRFSKIKIDDVIYSHGDSGAGRAPAALHQAKENFCSTVIGHFHAQAGVNFWANLEYRVFGMGVGCGIDVHAHEMDYGRKYPSKPILGCGVVKNGKIPYFEPWLLKSR
jgi:predicted phosphodiesterase